MAMFGEGLQEANELIWQASYNFRLVLCNGLWPEASATLADVLTTEVSSTRPIADSVIKTYNSVSNQVQIAIGYNGYTSPIDLTVNRIAIIKGGSSFGVIPVAFNNTNSFSLAVLPSTYGITTGTIICFVGSDNVVYTRPIASIASNTCTFSELLPTGVTISSVHIADGVPYIKRSLPGAVAISAGVATQIRINAYSLGSN